MKKSVIVVGGGIAGLAAARELAGDGFDVTLLEAKSRFGGRIHTLQHGRLPIELGAEFIHGRSKSLLKAIKEAGLSARKAPTNQRLFEDGRLKRMDLWGTIGEVVGRINSRRPDCSFKEFLAGAELDERTRRIAHGFAEGFDAAHADRISAHAMLKAQHSADQMEGEWQGRVDEGYSALVEYLARNATANGGRLIRQAVVKHIRWKPALAEVGWQQGRKTQSAVADAAILTLPLGVWKSGIVRFYPRLPGKQMAVRELPFGNVLKPIFVFKAAWWPASAGGFLQAPNEPLPTWWHDPRGPVLTGWAGGTKAEALRSLSPQKLETMCLEILGRLFSERPSSLRKRLVAMYHHRWEKDPDIRGAYSYIPVNGLGLPQELAAPVADTLFFAGEATVNDAQTGTVFGALDSGLRAAREVRKVFRHAKGKLH